MTPHRVPRSLLGGLVLVVAAASGMHCGSASNGAIPVGFGAGGAATQGGGRVPWSPGAGGAADAGTNNGDMTTGAGGGVASAQDGGSTVPSNLCPGVAHQDHPVTLTVSRSRATVSPVQARGVLLGAGGRTKTLPAASTLQLDEFLNYYAVDYHPSGSGLGVVAELAPGPFSPSELLLQLGVQAAVASTRPPLTITALVDTSIAMTGDGIARAVEALDAIVASLRGGDQIQVLTSGGAQTPLLSAAGPSDPAVLASIAQTVHVDGGEDFGGGVVKAYDLATAHASSASLNRVVLVTNGGVPYASVDFGLIAEGADEHDISVVGVGVGAAMSYDDRVLASAAEAGRGYDLFLDQPGEANVMLTSRFDEVMNVAARDVQVNLTLPWFATLKTPAAVPPPGGGTSAGAASPTDLSPGRALVYRGIVQLCDAQLVQYADGLDPILIEVASTSPVDGTRTTSSVTLPVVLKDASAAVLKANAVSAFVDALASGDSARWNQALALAQPLAADPDFGAPDVGILALLMQEKPLLH